MNVPDSVKNKLARSDVLHNYWSPLNWLDDKPENMENSKKHNGKTCERTTNDIGEEITLEIKRVEVEMENLLGDFEKLNSVSNAK